MRFPEDDDAVHFMARSSAQMFATYQTASSSSTSRSRSAASSDQPNVDEGENWRLAMVYTVDGQAVQVDVPWTDAHLRAQKIAQAFSITTEQVNQVYHVEATPQDLAQEELECFLLQREQDVPSSTLLRLILVDIEYRPDHRGDALRIVRRGFWLPHRSNAISIVRLLGYEGHCSPRYRRCALWHNHHVIDIEANHLLQLSHGDYVRFHLPWSPDDDMEYLFGQECQLESEDEHAALFQVQASIIVTDGGHFSGASTQHCPIQMRSIRERRPPRDLLPHALQGQLRALWERPHLRQRFPDRSEVMLFDTWFLSNRGFHRCGVPRLAALPPDVSTWISHLRHVWSDSPAGHPAHTSRLPLQPTRS